MTPKLWLGSSAPKFIASLWLLFATCIHVVLTRPVTTVMPTMVAMMPNESSSFTQTAVFSPTEQPGITIAKRAVESGDTSSFMGNLCDDIAACLSGPRLRDQLDEARREKAAEKEEHDELVSTLKDTFQSALDTQAEILHQVKLDSAIKIQQEKEESKRIQNELDVQKEQYTQQIEDGKKIKKEELKNVAQQGESLFQNTLLSAMVLDGRARGNRILNIHDSIFGHFIANPDFCKDPNNLQFCQSIMDQIRNEPHMRMEDIAVIARIGNSLQPQHEIGRIETASAETESIATGPTGENTNTNRRQGRGSGSCRPEDTLNLKKDDDDNDGSGFQPPKSGKDLGSTHVGTSYVGSEGKQSDSSEGRGVQDSSKSSNVEAMAFLSVLNRAAEEISKHFVSDSVYANQNPFSVLSEYNQVQSQPLSYSLEGIPVA